MSPFSPEHWLALTVIAVVVVTVVAAARRHRASGATERWVSTSGWVLLIIVVGWALRDLLPDRFSVEHSLPIDLSDLARFITVFALITRAGWAVVTVYFWGLTLNLQALITPNIEYHHQPALEYTMFWVGHGIVLLVPLVFVWGLGYRPTWQGFAFTYLLTVAWAAVGMAVNAVTGANYGYLRAPPTDGSPLDLMGPWPTYLLVVGVVLGVLWALLTWPWTTRRRRAGTEPAGRFMRRTLLGPETVQAR